MRFHRLFALFALAALVTSAGAATTPAGGRRARPAKAQVVDNSQTLDINNISMFVTNTGSFAYDKGTGNSGLEFPKGTGKTAVFAAGLWLGGKVGAETRVAVSEYSDEFGPGSALGGTFADPTRADFKVYKLNRRYPDDATRDAALADYEAGAEVWGAPNVTLQPDGSLDILGDQMAWAVYNDLDPTNHTNRAGTTNPLGVEVKQTTFAFNRQGALGNVIFIKYNIINRGGNTITNMYVSQWSDPDLGGFTDDLVACDTTLGLGYVYNADNDDEQYGSSPPSVGYDFFQGPTVGGSPLGMASFNKYINGTDPNTADKTYNYMLGLNADGTTVINPTTSQPTYYQVSGDPVTGAGWLDTSPADRRLMLSSGPFTLAPGDSQEVVTAIVVAQSSNRLASISLMKFYDTFAQAAFDAGFNLPEPPQAPIVTATPLDGGLRLSWATNAQNYSQAPYQFEGYVVYQGASVAGPFTRIATYDLKNGITTVLDDDFNEEQGLILPRGTAFGQDVGLRYTIDISEDAVRGGPLANGQEYYYTVNAYAVGIGEFPQVLESANNVFQAIPQTPAAGVDASSSSITGVTQSQVAPGPPASTDVVTVEQIDPLTMVDADWAVGFKPACGTCTNNLWYVTRTVGAQTDTVMNNLANYANNAENPVVDGIRVRVVSYPLGELARVSYEDTGANPQAIVGVDVGLRFFGGGADYANELFGSSIPSFSTTTNDCEIRFTGTGPGQYAYRYLRTLDGSGSRVYWVQDYVPVPFTVWDIDTNTQLNAGFLENDGAPTEDGAWGPDDSGLGGRELVWIMDSAYDGDATPDPAYLTDPNLMDVLGGNIDQRYALWPARVSAGAVIDAGDKIAFSTSIPSGPNDRFSFSTSAVNPMNVALAKSELARVKAVPNPYLTHSSYEQNQFNRELKFTHLPAVCTVKIFNLAGDLIRTLRKNDGTSQLTWDLETENGLPIGSGVYVFHVDAPGIGTHVGKVAVFMEKERLNNF